MSLQRFIDPMPVVRLAFVAAMLIVAGCGSSGPKPDAPDRAERPGKAADRGEQAVMPEISPQALTMFEQAVAIMAAGDFVDAELRFKEFLLRFPSHPAAHVNIAIIHSNNGNDEAAEAAIAGALALQPDYAPALNQQGMLLRRNGKFFEAEAAYLKAVTASPDYALAHYNLGILNELYLQRLEAALQHFVKYQELVGGDKQVEKWIADLERRLAANQRTANVAE